MGLALSPAYSFKSADLNGKGFFRGVASAFGGPPDAYGHIIAPGAFDASLRKHADLGTMPAMLWAHDMAEPIGAWLSIDENDQGLEVYGRLTLSTRRGADAYALMRDGGLTGLSVGIAIDDRGIECSGDECTIKQVERLAEISIVSVPANERAQITSVKSACGCNTIPELQRYFRESLGVKREVARRLAFACIGILSNEDPEDEVDPEQAAAFLKQIQKTTKLLF